MTVAVGDIVRVTAKFSWGSDENLNVFHVKNNGSSGVDDAAFMTAVAAWLDGTWQLINTHLASGMSYVSIEGYNVTQDAPIDEVAWPTLTAGAQTTDSAYALQTAALVKFGTQVAKSQGRKFIAGLTEAGVQGAGLLNSTVASALIGFAGRLITGFTASGEQFDFGNWNDTLSRFALWTYSEIGNYLATQRRRKAGVGS